MARLGTPRTHGRFTVNPTLFRRGGTFSGGYVALADIPEYGIRKGESVSRRKGIEISHGERLEKLVAHKHWRIRMLQRVYYDTHGTMKGFEQMLQEMAQYRSPFEKGLPSSPLTKDAAEGWKDVLERYGLYDRMTPSEKADVFGSEEVREEKVMAKFKVA